MSGAAIPRSPSLLYMAPAGESALPMLLRFDIPQQNMFLVLRLCNLKLVVKKGDSDDFLCTGKILCIARRDMSNINSWILQAVNPPKVSGVTIVKVLGLQETIEPANIYELIAGFINENDARVCFETAVQNMSPPQSPRQTQRATIKTE